MDVTAGCAPGRSVQGSGHTAVRSCCWHGAVAGRVDMASTSSPWEQPGTAPSSPLSPGWCVYSSLEKVQVASKGGGGEK